MTRRPATVLRSLFALAAVAAIVIGVPRLLIEWVGWPLPTRLPTPDDMTAAIRAGLTPDVATGALAVVVWIAWGQFTIAFAAELLGAVRNRPVRTAALVPGARLAAGRLVSTILLVATTTTLARPALALEPITTVTVEQPLDPTNDTPPTPTASDDRPVRVVTVAPRDSWWRIAETHLGDGHRWRGLRDLNVGRTLPDGTTITDRTDILHPGWELVVPHSDPPTGDPDSHTWTVARGDNLWDIAEHTLASTNGHTPSDRDTAAYMADVIDTNTDRLLDPTRPDLIIPGQQLHLPAIASTSQQPRPHEANQDDAPVEEPASDAPAPAPDPDATIADSAPPAPSDDPQDRHDRARSAAVTAPAPVAEAPSVSETRPAATGDSRPSERSDAGDDDPSAVLSPALAATALIGAGVLETLRRRRRAAYATRRAGMRYPTPHPGQQTTESRLAAAAAPERTLDELWELLRTIPDLAGPTLVRLQSDQVTLTFDDRPPDPPPPWRTSTYDAGEPESVWTAELGSSGPARSTGLPLLATLGQSDAADLVLANIAACGPLTVVGEPDDVRARLRTMALEVATSPVAHTPDVLVVGDHMFEALSGVRHTDDPTPDIVSCVAAVARGVHPDDRTPVLIVCHDVRDIQIPECSDIGLIRAGTDRAAAATVLEVDGSGRGVLRTAASDPLVLALPEIDPSIVADTLDGLEHPVLHVDQQHPDATAPSGEPAGDRTPAASGVDDDPPWCEVRLLGPVGVHIDSQPVDLSPQLLELAVFLATHRGSATPERVQDALWPGVSPRLAAERARKAVTRLRVALGDGPDGEPLVPHRRKNGDGRIELDDDVASDLDTALAHLAAARGAPPAEQLDRTLQAVGMVRGEPFETLPLSWATEVTQRAIVELQDAAERAAGPAMTLDRHDDGIRALRRALRLLPANEMLHVAMAEIEVARGRPDAAARVRRDFVLIATLDENVPGVPSDAWNRLDALQPTTS